MLNSSKLRLIKLSILSIIFCKISSTCKDSLIAGAMNVNQNLVKLSTKWILSWIL
ncbi:hypothetical protein ACKGJI_03545 [Sulfurospirillum sp. 1307]